MREDLYHSRTMAGAAAACGLTIADALGMVQLAGFAGIDWLVPAVVLLCLALIVYARIDDFRKRVR